jgi:hypothetical protein
MKRYISIMVLILLFTLNTKTYTLDFPPELSWWINEVRKVNKNIDVDSFTFSDKKIVKIERMDRLNHLLIYPVFMRWNYSGNYVAYDNFYHAKLIKQKSGKYAVEIIEDSGLLLIADRNKNVFFTDYFHIQDGLHSIHWLTDTLLVGVGISYIGDYYYGQLYEDSYVDLCIKYYKINNNTVEVSTYTCERAIKSEDRLLLKLDWFEQRSDYFEIGENK